MNPFGTLEIAAALVFCLALVLFLAHPDLYPTPFAVFMLVVLAASILLLDRRRRRR